MSFTIQLQKNKSENNKAQKKLTNLMSLTGTLRENTSIIDPVIKVEADLQELTGCNYMTISIFGRSYFVTDIISIRTNLCEIRAHCDVLSSFYDEYKKCSGIVKRQENAWNLYVDDGVFKTFQNPMVITKEFPSGFNTMEFVLAVAGS